jgi:hypothetical protein
MSSYFDDASLVMIPSGYKTSKVYSVKPTDGTGDLTFSRSNDTATRVASNGLIEKVRTNLVTYSEQLNNTSGWGFEQLAVTANAVANPLDGAVTADKIYATVTGSSVPILKQTIAATANQTITVSGYFKKLEYDYVLIHGFGLGGTSFNLAAGTKSGTGTITNVGNGWYRCAAVLAMTVDSRIFITPSIDGSVSYVSTANSGIYAFGVQVELGDIATPYIATTTAAVSVGPVANVPRLDYLNSSCPRLLLEPQRTNNALYSEQLDNAAWTKQNTTVTANVVTSPSGYQDADKLVETSATGAHRASVSSAATLNGTFSFFAKAGERTKVAILSTTIDLGFDLSNGTLINLGSGTSVGKIENYGNGWYRCSLPQASGIVALSLALLDNANNITYTGNGTSGAYFWGAQLEVGAYATSYIPTLGASVTRGADAASKTGISSLIGQTEGTLFAEFTRLNVGNAVVLFQCNDGTTNNRAQLEIGTSGIATGVVLSGGAVSCVITGPTLALGQTHKFALTYKANDFKLYVNGVLAGTDTSGAVAVSMSRIDLASELGTSYGGVSVSQILNFTTALSNDQAIELTA